VYDVLPQAFNNLILPTIGELVQDLIQREVNDIVMMELFRRNRIAQPQPELMDQIDLICGEVRHVRAKHEELALAGGEEYLKVESGPWRGQSLPAKSNLARLLGHSPLGRTAEDDSRRLQIQCGAKNAVKDIIGSYDGQMHRLAVGFGKRKSFGEKLLFGAAKHLVGFELGFTRRRAVEQTDMEHEDVSTFWPDAIKDGGELM
jgi:hypothetical protein